ncbi:MAG: response regulator [Oscillospiraceae bacterium]|nr:response regulator [Oscillospiraceae bacterium]
MNSTVNETKTDIREEQFMHDKNHILICDDDIMFLKIVSDWLKGRYYVTAVRNGPDAVPAAYNERPDLILLDLEMPGMSGPEVLEALRTDEQTANIPVVFLTGHSDRDSVMDCLKLRPQGYMLKTVKRQGMLASIDNFFESGRWMNIEA